MKRRHHNMLQVQFPDAMTLLALIISLAVGFGGKIAGELKKGTKITRSRFLSSLLTAVFMSYMAYMIVRWKKWDDAMFVIIPSVAYLSDYLYDWFDHNSGTIFNRILNVFLPEKNSNQNQLNYPDESDADSICEEE